MSIHYTRKGGGFFPLVNCDSSAVVINDVKEANVCWNKDGDLKFFHTSGSCGNEFRDSHRYWDTLRNFVTYLMHNIRVTPERLQKLKNDPAMQCLAATASRNGELK